MVSYRSLRHIGLMTVVAAAAIMAAGVVWAAPCAPDTEYVGTLNSSFVPNGGHLKQNSDTPTCTTDETLSSVSCNSYTIVGLGNDTTSGATNLVVHYATPAPVPFSARNNVTVPPVSSGPATISDFTYTLQFQGFTSPAVLISCGTS